MNHGLEAEFLSEACTALVKQKVFAGVVITINQKCEDLKPITFTLPAPLVEHISDFIEGCPNEDVKELIQASLADIIMTALHQYGKREILENGFLEKASEIDRLMRLMAKARGLE